MFLSTLKRSRLLGASLSLMIVFNAAAALADSESCAHFKKQKVCEGDEVALADPDPQSVFRQDIVIDQAGPGEHILYHVASVPKMRPVPAKLSALKIVHLRDRYRGVAVGQHFTLESNGRYNIVIRKLYDDGTVVYRSADDPQAIDTMGSLDGLHPIDYKVCPKNKPDGCDNPLGFTAAVRSTGQPHAPSPAADTGAEGNKDVPGSGGDAGDHAPAGGDAARGQTKL